MKLNRRQFFCATAVVVGLLAAGDMHQPAPVFTEPSGQGIHYRGTYDGWPQPGVPPRWP